MIKIIGALIIIFVIWILYRYQYRNENKNKYYKKEEDIPNDAIILFYSPNCMYCKQFKPQWDEFRNRTVIPTREFSVIDPTFRYLAQDYQIQGVPHIVRDRNGIRTVYTGNRTVDDMLKFFER